MRIILSLWIAIMTSTKAAGLHQAFYTAKQNTRLHGHIIRSQRADSIITCAHYCSLESQCTSFNYKSSRGQGSCELNRQTADLEDNWRIETPGWSYAHMVKQKSATPVVNVKFTSLNGKGNEGPVTTAGYEGTPLEGKVQLQAGMQIWSVPHTGTYEITALGASGGNGTRNVPGAPWKLGGLGARIRGQFHLDEGTQIKVLVGQRGSPCNAFEIRPGSGGGGSFVTLMDNAVLVIAGGGGGGAGIGPNATGCLSGDAGQADMNGTRYGGTGGLGGNLYDPNKGVNQARTDGSAGGGMYGDGTIINTMGPMETGGQAFINGGKGGNNVRGGPQGGFGGGGFGATYPGGGSGYSGGGVIGDGDVYIVAGGGGSYNNGTSQTNVGGANHGDGLVVIKLIDTE